MKKPILKSLFLLIIAVIFSGCFAIHSGTVYNSASLSSANFSYVNMNVEGSFYTLRYWIWWTRKIHTDQYCQEKYDGESSFAKESSFRKPNPEL
ncbi:MAG: hypothetical protein IPO63_09230 [Bacteroidetes bacterium]|nr:hypothetical protein [Bacteroidota bacterium]